jgi:thiamine-phosphate pyrophosphorylase
MTDAPPLRPRTQLYLITPPLVEEPAPFRDTLLAALDRAGAIACLQVRQKDDGVIHAGRTRELAQLVLPPLRERGIAVFINDSPEIARDVGADGVHLGTSDMDLRSARKIIGSDMILGASAQNSRHRAMQAGEDGADYVAFGAFYPTTTKTGTARAELDLLEFWQETMLLPCVAIGGITPQNAEPLVVAGADFIAVTAGVWQHPGGPGAAIAEFNTLFDRLAPR